jgi:hypothetical protein
VRLAKITITALVLATASPTLAQTQNNSNLNTLGNTSVNSQQQSATGIGIGVGTGGSASQSQTNTGVNVNTNSVDGQNINKNTNSQGVTTTTSPVQSLSIGGSVNLPQLPATPGVPTNFSQPYLPNAFLNGGSPVLPARMTLAEAEACRGGWGFKDSYYGKSNEASKEIRLVYPARDKIDYVRDMADYLGVSSVRANEKPFLPALCEAAYHAMRNGATAGIVESVVRPKNFMAGIGFGASGGATGLPGNGPHPYALAGNLGFGTGVSSQKVEGELLLQITCLRPVTKRSAEIIEQPPMSLSVTPPRPVKTPEGAVVRPPLRVAPVIPDLKCPENRTQVLAAIGGWFCLEPEPQAQLSP